MEVIEYTALILLQQLSYLISNEAEPKEPLVAAESILKFPW